MKRNPFINGFLCTTFRMVGKDKHENVMNIVILAETREKAVDKVKKAFGPFDKLRDPDEPEYKFTLNSINVIS